MKLLIVNNLASGLGDGSIYDFVRSFLTDGDEVSIRSTDGTTDIADLLHDAELYDAVVASGGDGTVAEPSFQLRDSSIPVFLLCPSLVVGQSCWLCTLLRPLSRRRWRPW